jgi:hypothetical protein
VPKSGRSEPDLEAVIRAWPTLSESVRANILVIVRGAK